MKPVLAFLALLLVAAGCTLGETLRDDGEHVDMTRDALVGTWLAGTQRAITFVEDGTFTAVNLPYPPFADFLTGFDPAHDRLDGSGRWALLADPEDPGSPHARVALTFTLLDGQPTHMSGADLSALRPGDGKVYLVFFYVSDQGNSTTGYLKCASDCVVSTP